MDSRTVGMAQGMGVQSAVVAAADGRGADEVRAFAEERLARTKVYFYVPSLEQLRRGGRIGAAASLWGTMFSIKPILAVDGGKVVPLEKVRSAARAIARLEEIAAADALSRPQRRGHGSPCTTSATRPRRSSWRPGWPAACPSARRRRSVRCPAVLAAHAGLGVLAVIVGESSTPLPGAGPTPGAAGAAGGPGAFHIAVPAACRPAGRRP